MLTTIKSVKVNGIEAVPVTVECEVSSGIGIHVVGLADAAVKGSLLRTVTAIQAAGYRIPGKKIVINLAPADLHKSGSGYDLPIAIGMLSASEQVGLPDLDKWLVCGEAGLDGTIRCVDGCVQTVLTAQGSGLKGCIIPSANADEVGDLVGTNAPVYAAGSIQEAIDIIKSPKDFPTVGQKAAGKPAASTSPRKSCYESLVGEEGTRRAVEIAAAGGHNVLLIGPKGSPKQVIARALTELLPPMTKDETITAAKIYSNSGRSYKHYHDYCPRPFRAPHYSASLSAMFGGGSGDSIRPGEVSLAHGGVLCLEDINLFPRNTREGLRAVLEDKKVTISRLRSRITFPADTQIVASCQPCPCGHYGDGEKCTCTEAQRLAYMSKLDSALLERIDIQHYTHTRPAVPAKENTESIEDVRARIAAAREMQRNRFAGTGIRTNAEIPVSMLDSFCPLDKASARTLEKIITLTGLSARTYTHILRIARSIADLEGADDIALAHIAEASSFRFLDRRKPTD